MDWDAIYRNTRLEDLHWYPGAADDLLQQAVADGWLRGPAILDVGSGQGTDAIYLAAKGYRVTALDQSEGAREVALREAQAAGVQLAYVVGNALAMPFGDADFDSVVERGCFHHIAVADRQTYACEIARVLKPGGSYLYRAFSANSQFRARPEELLTEDAVRAVFAPHFTIHRFGTYHAMGEGGRSSAEMHWALMTK